jgi:hypothetical protein
MERAVPAASLHLGSDPLVLAEGYSGDSLAN